MPKDGTHLPALTQRPTPPTAGAASPAVPPALEGTVAALLEHGTLSAPLGGYPAAERAHAVAAIETFEEGLRPASLEQTRRLAKAWVSMLMPCLDYAPNSREAVDDYCNGLVDVGADLPAFVWTRDTYVIALRTFTKWPSIAEAYKLLSAHAARARVHLMMLKVIAKEPPAPMYAGDRMFSTGETVDEVRASMRMPAMPRSAPAAEPPPRRPTVPNTLPPDRLRAWRASNPRIIAAIASKDSE
nr:hypothetical protein [uncultured Roseococcus sp.]